VLDPRSRELLARRRSVVPAGLLGPRVNKGSRCESGAAPATVTGDEGEHDHWGKCPGKGSLEDDPEARRPTSGRRNA
jgi:hypothetical protein